jgi:ribose-phosphate pyrophosphokinase
VESETLALFTGNANPALAHDIARHLRLPVGHARRSAASAMASQCRDHGERARPRCLHRAAHLSAGERSPDGTAGDGGCLPARLGGAHHGGGALFRLRAPGPAAARDALGDHREAGRRHDQRSGVDRLLTLDLHSDQIQGFFGIPVDNVYGSPVLLGDVWRQRYPNLIVVSPDVGGVVRARAFAKRLDDADLAIIDKRRPRPNESKVMNIIGEVDGKTCVLIDDMVDTAGTLCLAAQALKEEGALKVVAYITHAVLSGGAVERIATSALDELVVTDTIPLSEAAQASAGASASCRWPRCWPRRSGAYAMRSR